MLLINIFYMLLLFLCFLGIKEYLFKMVGCNKLCVLRNIVILFLKWVWNMNNWVYVLFGCSSNYKYCRYVY